jgi:hypothetical protein
VFYDLDPLDCRLPFEDFAARYSDLVFAQRQSLVLIQPEVFRQNLFAMEDGPPPGYCARTNAHAKGGSLKLKDSVNPRQD